ncbi:uncharacterized protein LOC134276393 isoform X1 [Saccostrea cucullata]|uniref:uncharacterized protein LOC134276393 isoform X1 n=2 Tax=Saccostrea cuccullata TaxID=36930 RepID=UPI002ED5AEA1
MINTLLKKSLLFFSRFSGKLRDVSWEDVFNSFSDCGVSNVLNIIDLVLSLPPTSVINETAFNQMKLLKTERRHRLSNQHLNDCMVIRLESAQIMDFDPQPAIDRWMLTGNRRTSYKRSSFKKREQVHAEAETVTESVTETETEIENTESNIIDIEQDAETRQSEAVNESESESESESECESDFEQNESENENRIREIVREMEIEREF